MPNPSILIVDDEEGLQSSLATAFAAEGYRAEGAGSAGQALACLQRAPFDVLLTDLVMPGADGLVLMEQVRALYPDTVIILMTGGATVESAVRALKGGPTTTSSSPSPWSRFSTWWGRGWSSGGCGRKISS